MPDLHQENKVFLVSAIRDILLGFLDILYPRHCFACDKSLHEEKNTYICESCLEIIKTTDAMTCPPKTDPVVKLVLWYNWFKKCIKRITA